MATQTYEQLLAGANKIKENELPESNTHSLVGDQLFQMASKQQEEHSLRIKGTTEYNVSVQFPTGGVDGTNKYTLELAIGKVPAELRTIGLKCSFLNEEGKPEMWKYQGDRFTMTGSWIQTDGKYINEKISNLGAKIGLFTSRESVETSEHSITLKVGRYYIRSSHKFISIDTKEDVIYKDEGSTALVYNTLSKSIITRSLAASGSNLLQDEDIILAASDAVEGFVKNTPLYNYIVSNLLSNHSTLISSNKTLSDTNKKICGYDNYNMGLFVAKKEPSAYSLINNTSLEDIIRVYIQNNTGKLSKFRIVGVSPTGNKDFITYDESRLGEYMYFIVDKDDYTDIRCSFNQNDVITEGNISFNISKANTGVLKELFYKDKIIKDNTKDIEEIKQFGDIPSILFPIPKNIYCAVGTDMNLYYENMFGMLVGSGYMFIDTPNIVYDTSAEDNGDYDSFLNLERQLHFKPNKAGNMQLYLNIWDEYMRQIASKITILHIVDTAYMNDKTINMLVNGSSSIDIGTFQAEIKRLLESVGVTVNMVGRWASGNNLVGTEYNLKTENRLSENRSGGASDLYTTKANSGKTKIVHPTNITDVYFGWNTELEDEAGNKWMVWGNNSAFVELVLKSGNVDMIPQSGVMTKTSGSGIESLTYDRLITNVPQTTNPFWNNADNGISFADYCSNWNRPIPNVFVTLWGTNDIRGSGGNIQTGKQWATDAQINKFIDSQKILVDAYTRDCPNGVIIMCPQPTGSVLTGKKNSDRNGMLYTKLKATQALMDAFSSYDNVIIVPVQWWFDRKWAYTLKNITISKRMKDYYQDIMLDIVSDDTTHPDSRGYYQMADAAYSAIIYWITNFKYMGLSQIV